MAALLKAAQDGGRKLEWLNCGLCVDERGVGEAIDSGTPRYPDRVERMTSEPSAGLALRLGP